MKSLKLSLGLLLLMVWLTPVFAYQHFKVAVYCTQKDVRNLSDKAYFEQSLKELRKYLTIDKVYLEVHRGKTNDLQTMLKVKKMFEREGIATAGGITATLPRSDAMHFGVLCYSDKQQVDHLFKAVKIAAQAFDEFILDDFFFTSCRSPQSIRAKGNLSWTDFRLKELTDVSRRMVKLARSVNPKIKVIIKYPNWYPFYQNTGYNLATQPRIFDGIYTGTETRDRIYTHQNLQPYQSYLIMRYLNNVAPGRNGGGWVDPLARGTLDRYAQQLALTVLGGAKEVMLFHWDGLFRHLSDHKLAGEMAAVAGVTFRTIDDFAGMLTRPEALTVYRPVNSSGENFVADYLGMIGIPVELTPQFPKHPNSVLLTAGAAHDAGILAKIKTVLSAGGRVILTSGFLKSMQDKGLGDLMSARLSGYASVNRASDLNFRDVFNLSRTVQIPIITAPTNDCWSEVLGISPGGNAYPLLVGNEYAKGRIFVLTIPDDYSDLYALPRQTLLQIKRFILEDQNILLEAPPEVSLFVYESGLLVVQSFLRHNTRVVLHFKRPAEVSDFFSGQALRLRNGKREQTAEVALPANQMRVFRFKWKTD